MEGEPDAEDTRRSSLDGSGTVTRQERLGREPSPRREAGARRVLYAVTDEEDGRLLRIARR